MTTIHRTAHTTHRKGEQYDREKIFRVCECRSRKNTDSAMGMLKAFNMLKDEMAKQERKNEMPCFMTINELAKKGILSEYALRKLEKQGKLPCIYSGRRCLINYDLLIEQLEGLGNGGNK